MSELVTTTYNQAIKADLAELLSLRRAFVLEAMGCETVQLNDDAQWLSAFDAGLLAAYWKVALIHDEYGIEKVQRRVPGFKTISIDPLGHDLDLQETEWSTQPVSELEEQATQAKEKFEKHFRRISSHITDRRCVRLSLSTASGNIPLIAEALWPLLYSNKTSKMNAEELRLSANIVLAEFNSRVGAVRDVLENNSAIKTALEQSDRHKRLMKLSSSLMQSMQDSWKEAGILFYDSATVLAEGSNAIDPREAGLDRPFIDEGTRRALLAFN